MKKTLIIVVITLVVCTIYLSINGFNKLINFIDITFIVGAVTFLVGCLSKVSSLGAFSIFGYTGYYSANAGKKKKYNDYNDYLQKKEVSRSSKKNNFIVYFIIGGVYILISLLLTIIK